MFNNDKLEKIAEIHSRVGNPEFRMALQFLFDNGHQNFTPANVRSFEKHLLTEESGNLLIPVNLQRKLLCCACELNQFNLWDILLYVKLYVGIRGDDALQLEEADKALSIWNGYQAPEEWKSALANPDSRMEILREMVKRHDSEYSMAEIRTAIQAAVNSGEEE